jgi:hypothetical protein
MGLSSTGLVVSGRTLVVSWAIPSADRIRSGAAVSMATRDGNNMVVVPM